MSKTFTRKPAEETVHAPRVVKNYITPGGLQRLRDERRFLLAREGDERWEQIIASPQRRPKLDAFLKESAEETAEPLDPDQL